MVGTQTPLVDPKAMALAVAGLAMAFALKHYLADFVMQTNWMARGKEQPTGWLRPLLVHVACHAGLTLALAFVFAPRLWWLALVDFGIHFGVDRSKTALSQWGGWKPDRPQFWWLLGFDQFLHQLTNIALAAAIGITTAAAPVDKVFGNADLSQAFANDVSAAQK